MPQAMRVAVGLTALVAAHAAHGAELVETICKDAPNGLVSPAKLRSQALAGASLSSLDLDGDAAISADEVRSSLVRNTCQASPGRCSKEDDLKLRSARNALDGLLENHPGIELEQVGEPTAAQLIAEPDLESKRAQLVDPAGRFFRVRCSAARLAKVEEKPKPQLPPILVGKDLESLTAKRGPPGARDRYKAVKQAEIGFTNDHEKRSESVNVDGLVGVKFGKGTTAVIPFVQYVRAEVKDKANDTEKLSGKFGLGALVTFYAGKDQFDIAPYFTKDLEHESQLLTARLAWRPGLLYDMPTFNNAWHFACRRAENGACVLGSGLALVTDGQLIVSGGTVIKEGDDPKLTDGREFLRVGPSVTAQVYGLDGLVRDLSVDLSYKRLFRLAGDREKIWSFKAGINYWIAGSEHVSLRYGYEVGRDEDTLKKIDVTKLGLGLRF